MCVVEKGAKKCKKCMKDKRSCYWNGTPLTNKGKAPQKAPALKQLIPMVEIKTNCPQKVTEKTGKSHIITICSELICIPLRSVPVITGLVLMVGMLSLPQMSLGNH